MPARKLHFAEGLKLPQDAVTETFAFLGRKGAGKTYGAGKLVEELLTVGAQVVVIDTVGNWYGLRIGKGGKGTGFDIPVLGGEHGDIPLEKTGGALVADLIVDHGTSMVVDITMMRKGARQTFMIDFAEQLFERKKRQRSPMHVVIEEAQKLIPQQSQGKGGQIHRLKGAMEDLVRIGRNYGIGCSMLSQRPQSVDKEVLNQVEALVCFQTTGPHERKAIREWVVDQGIDTKLVEALPGLPVGTCYFWSPQWLDILDRFKVLPKQTHDASATPKMGQTRKPPKPLAKSDLTGLREAMADSIAKHEENDPTALKRRVRELEAEVRKLQAAEPEVRNIRVEVPVVAPATVKKIEELRDLLRGDVDHANELVNSCSEVAHNLQAAVIAANNMTNTQQVLQQRGTQSGRIQSKKPNVASAPRPAPPVDSDIKLVGKMRDILAALASTDGHELTRKQLAVQVGMSPGSGGFNNYVGKLSTQGLVETGRGTVSLTDQGHGYANGVRVACSPQEILDLWLPKLTGRTKDILQLLFDSPDTEFTRAEVAEHVGMAFGSGGFNNYIGKLSSLDLITTGRGMLCLNREVFHL